MKINKTDFMELMIGVLTAKLNAKHCFSPSGSFYLYCKHPENSEELTVDEISFIRTVIDNIYTFAVADGMNRAFEAMRKDFKLPEEEK